MPDHDKDMIRAACSSGEPVESLIQVVIELASKGRAQAEIYCELEAALATIPPDTALYDVVLDVMDKVWGGGWGGRPVLFEVALTDEAVTAARLRRQP